MLRLGKLLPGCW